LSIPLLDRTRIDYKTQQSWLALCHASDVTLGAGWYRWVGKPTLTLQEHTISFVHQSAKDYLTEHTSAKIFPDKHTEEQQRIVSRSIEAIDKVLERDVYGLRHPGCSINKVKQPDLDLLAPIQYACVYWVNHLCEIKSSHDKVGLYNNSTINVFLRKHFLHWLEALSLIKGISDGVLVIAKLIGLLTVSYYLTKVQYLQILIYLENFVWIPTFSSRLRYVSVGLTGVYTLVLRGNVVVLIHVWRRKKWESPG
jgi:hypothetical protein